MQKWEYCHMTYYASPCDELMRGYATLYFTETITEDEDDDIREVLRNLGEEGWEAVGFTNTPGPYDIKGFFTYLFKRPLED